MKVRSNCIVRQASPRPTLHKKRVDRPFGFLKPPREVFSSDEKFWSYLKDIKLPKKSYLRQHTLHSPKSSPKQSPSLATPEKTREALSKLSFHPLNPFVASVAMAIDMTRFSQPEGTFSIPLKMPEFYNNPLNVTANFENGPDAPLLVIFNGVHAEADSNVGDAMAHHASQKGFNFVSIPNPTGVTSLKANPKVLPGNPQNEAAIGLEILKQLRKNFPDHTRDVSITGYSYGGLQAINIARYQEEELSKGRLKQRLINRSVTTVNPPRNLRNSMRRLDKLRQKYHGKSLNNKYWMAIRYKWDTLFKKYNRFPSSSLSKRMGDKAATEAKVADIYGSREGLRTLLQYCEGWNPKYRSSKTIISDDLKTDHLKGKDTYEHLLRNFATRDPWYKENQTHPIKVMHQWSYPKALSELKDSPLHIVTLSSKDDYILSGTDVRSIKKVERNYNQNNFSTKFFDHGGHVGLLFNPEIFSLLCSTW